VREAKLWVYRHGKMLAQQLVCLNLARAGRESVTPDIVKILNDWTAPPIPVNGVDVMAAGIPKGPEIGDVLAKIETWWIENDFAPDRESCLQFLAMLVPES
jgi:tRNA nucleotidyltransferase/poly(A) polymerase